MRNFCGHVLPEGMEKNQPFDAPILTPSTKAEKGGHDESVSSDEIIKRGLVDERIYREMERIALALYRFGNQKVAEDNLILVDTKYEFGLFDNELMLIDEIHTPDSSRFWIKETYDGLFSQGEEPPISFSLFWKRAASLPKTWRLECTARNPSSVFFRPPDRVS
ncbi:MAG TPA: hypothetical protein EYQ20_18615 [candidate division Zixibacteria bacterium]|nr:hypothetical protein [candidate division Zixibacteria bacterium]